MGSLDGRCLQENSLKCLEQKDKVSPDKWQQFMLVKKNYNLIISRNFCYYYRHCNSLLSSLVYNPKIDFLYRSKNETQTEAVVFQL